MSEWPWLTDVLQGQAGGTTRLRDLLTGQQVRVRAAATESSTCTPTWCRVMVAAPGGRLDHIDVMHPDGTGRHRIAGSGAQAAVADVAVLGRFEILAEPGPDSDLSGTAALLVHDLRTGGTVSLSPAAGSVATRDGILWWATGDRETTLWHTLDLRTVK